MHPFPKSKYIPPLGSIQTQFYCNVIHLTFHIAAVTATWPSYVETPPSSSLTVLLLLLFPSSSRWTRKQNKDLEYWIHSLLQGLLKEEYWGNKVLLLPDVTFQDCTGFLELVYTGKVKKTSSEQIRPAWPILSEWKVSMPEDRRPTFTALLELFSVIDDIGECVTFHSGLEKDLGGGVTIQRVDRNRSKVEINAC